MFPNAGGMIAAIANGTHGPGSIRIDLGLTRSFRIAEGQSMEFRFEAFNATNHVNPLLSSTTSQTITDARFGQILGAADPRIMQVALKYVFQTTFSLDREI